MEGMEGIGFGDSSSWVTDTEGVDRISRAMVYVSLDGTGESERGDGEHHMDGLLLCNIFFKK